MIMEALQGHERFEIQPVVCRLLETPQKTTFLFPGVQGLRVFFKTATPGKVALI